jgi:hypothetical protein
VHLGGHTTAIRERQKLLDFVQREAEPLRSLDCANPANRRLGIGSLARGLPLRHGQQPAPLVVAQCLDVYARLPRELARSQHVRNDNHIGP